MSIYKNKCEKECSYCKKKFSTFFFDLSHYVYKVKKGKTFIYQCSYPCYKKEKGKYENNRNAT